MHLGCIELTQVCLIIIIKQRQILVKVVRVFFFEDFPEWAVHLLAFAVVALVISHLIDKEQGQSLYALGKQSAFLFKMRRYCLAYLHALHCYLTAVAVCLTASDRDAVEESDTVTQCINL